MTEVEKAWYNEGYTVGFRHCKEKVLKIIKENEYHEYPEDEGSGELDFISLRALEEIEKL